MHIKILKDDEIRTHEQCTIITDKDGTEGGR